MNWVLDKSKPICPQIVEQISLLIATGQIQPGEKLFSVREVAVAAGVNPNTVQRSFEQLEQQGILFSQRGAGWFAAEDISLAKNTLETLKNEKTAQYIDSMQALGMTFDQIKNYVKEWEQ